MSGLRFVSIVAGVQRLLTAITSSAGVGDANKILATGADGRLDASFMPSGFEGATKVYPTSENIDAGELVNIYDVAGTATARLADGANGRPANGYATTSAVSPANVTVASDGFNSNLSGLTAGVAYGLSQTVPGDVTALSALANTTGLIYQPVGTATSATEIDTELAQPVTID